MAQLLRILNDKGAVQVDAQSPVMMLVPPGYTPPYSMVAVAPDSGARYTFGPPVEVPPRGFDIVLRDGTGRITFSTAQKPMRVAGIIDIPDANGGFFAGIPGRSYAVVYPGFIGGYGWQATNTILVGGNYEFTEETWYEPYTFEMRTRTDGASHILLVEKVTTSAQGYGDRRDQPPDQVVYGQVLVVDVTNY